MWNTRPDDAQTGVKYARRNIKNLRYADNTKLMKESKEELKSLLMKMKEEREKAGLQLNSIQKTKIMASDPITSWQIDGETMETVRVYFLGLQNHCRWWLEPQSWKILAPLKKSYDKSRQPIKKLRYHFADKGIVKGMFFSSSHVWMWKLVHEVGPPSTDNFELCAEDSWESLGDCKEINRKGNQSWIFIRRTDAESWSSHTLSN